MGGNEVNGWQRGARDSLQIEGGGIGHVLPTESLSGRKLVGQSHHEHAIVHANPRVRRMCWGKTKDARNPAP